MTEGARRGVTRGYVGGLVVACAIVAAALLVAGWGGLGLALDREPVATDGVPRWAAPLILALALAMLAGSLWQQALVLLRGRRAPSWGAIIATAGGAYLMWCLGGILAGMSIEETWLSPFAALLAPIWGIAAVLFWAVLARRVYTNRPAPKWPWERREEGE